jgi:N-acyl-D-amino-acid deacylase
MLDVVLRNGTVFDGTGTEGTRADVGVQGEWISAVGDLASVQARRTLDCAGLYVTPGFIDMHSHADLDLVADPLASPKIRMGVTLEVLGQDGISVAPIRPEHVPEVKARLGWLLGDHVMDWPWQRVGEYLGRLHRRTAINVMYLVPHGALRWWVMGFTERPATPVEIDAMCGLLRESLQDGAVGTSTGLIYPPCIYAQRDELLALARATAQAGGFWVVHLRNEGSRCEEALQEMLDLARASGCPLHLSHFKISGRAEFHKADRLVAMLEQGIQEGVQITFDQYPYAAGSTALSACLPGWALAGGADAAVLRLRNPTERARLRADIEGPGGDAWDNMSRAATYDGIVISAVASSGNQALVGTSLAEIGRHRGIEPVEALFDVLAEERLNATMVIHSQSEEVVARFMRLPYQTFGTDGFRGIKPHPRLHGTFPRVLGKYVRESGHLTWADAIRRMTGAAAARLGVKDQGLIRTGMRASITVFDPTTVSDRSTFADPTQDPEGIRYVVVNGHIALDGGQETKVLAGRVCGPNWRD